MRCCLWMNCASGCRRCEKRRMSSARSSTHLRRRHWTVSAISRLPRPSRASWCGCATPRKPPRLSNVSASCGSSSRRSSSALTASSSGTVSASHDMTEHRIIDCVPAVYTASRGKLCRRPTSVLRSPTMPDRVRIIGSYLSPYVRKVLVCLHLKGVPYEIDPIVPFMGGDRFSTLSPLRRVPVLVDDGVTLADSPVTCQYLEDRHPQPPVYPPDVP